MPLIIYALSYVDYGTLPLRSFLEFMGTHFLDIYLGQMIGLFGFYRNASGNVWVDLVIGLIISVISAMLLYDIQKYFWKLVHFISVQKR